MRIVLVILASTLVTLAACVSKPTEPLRMKAIDLGTAVDADGRISAPARQFDPHATVFVSISTEGGGPGTFHVRFVGNAEVLSEQSKDVDPDGPTHVVFQFAPPNGWPAGRSRVLFWMNDAEKHSAEFDVG
jgi:hypothetical protein